MAQQRKSMVYEAPLCKQPGCGHHTWSLYCPNHRNQKAIELSNADPRGLSIYDKQLLREYKKKDTQESIAICEDVNRVLPGFFESTPTPDDLENAALSAGFTASAAELARKISLAGMENQEVEDSDIDDDSVAQVIDIRGLSSEDIYAASQRHDFFGRSPQDGSILLTYLLKSSYEARIARGDKQDSRGISVERPLAEYAEDKQQRWFDEDLLTEYMSGLDGRAESVPQKVSRFIDVREKSSKHDNAVLAEMFNVKQEMGSQRGSGYTQSPRETVRPDKEYAWSNCDTMEIEPIADVPPVGNNNETRIFEQVPSSANQYGVNPGDPNPSPRNNGKPVPKYVNPNTGIVYDENMNPIMSTRPPETDRNQSAQRSAIPEGMIRQRGNDVLPPEDHWNSSHANPTHSQSSDSPRFGLNSALRKTGSVLGKGIGTAVRAGWSYHEAGKEVDADNRVRHAQYQQDLANEKIIKALPGSNSRRSFFNF